MPTGNGKQRDSRDEWVERRVAALAATLGQSARVERRRRGLGLREVAAAAGLSDSMVSAVELGRVGSLETYVRLGRTLGLQPDFALVAPRRRAARAEDPVHAAIVEVLAAQLRRPGVEVRLDEPCQHYQFAGRGDLVASQRELRSLLQTEIRTAFPNLQEAIGSFNAKRAYLGTGLAERAGLVSWASESHVIVALWSADVPHQVRLHRATFETICPDPPEAFEAWWRGTQAPRGFHATFVLFDPIEGRRSDRRRWVGLEEALCPTLKPRYRDYADAFEALEREGQV